MIECTVKLQSFSLANHHAVDCCPSGHRLPFPDLRNRLSLGNSLVHAFLCVLRGRQSDHKPAESAAQKNPPFHVNFLKERGIFGLGGFLKVSQEGVQGLNVLGWGLG